MKIDTKYDLGQSVYWLDVHQNESGWHYTVEGPFTVDSITINRIGYVYVYLLSDGTEVHEAEIFPNIAEAQTERDRRDWGKQ